MEDDEQVEMLGRHLGVEIPAARQEREAMSEIDNRQTTNGADSEEEVYVRTIELRSELLLSFVFSSLTGILKPSALLDRVFISLIIIFSSPKMHFWSSHLPCLCADTVLVAMLLNFLHDLLQVDDISEPDSDPSSNFQQDDTGQNGPEVVDLERSHPQFDSVDEENDSNEDDEDSILAAMLKSHLRQNTATNVSTERSESGTANGSIEIEEFIEHFSPPPSHNDTGHCSNEDGEKDENDDEDEDSILAAMLSSQKNKQKAVAADRVEIASSVEDGDRHKDNETNNFAASEEAGVSISQDEFTVKDSYPNKEVGESVGKGKARRRAKQEKKQAAVFDRHAATAAELASKERTQGEVLNNDSKVDRTDDLPPTEVSNAEQGWEESMRLKEVAQQNRSKLSQRGKKMKKGKVFA